MKSFNEWVKLFEKESTLAPGYESFYPRYIVRFIKESDFESMTGEFNSYPGRPNSPAESIWRTLEEAKNHIKEKMGHLLNVPFKPAESDLGPYYAPPAAGSTYRTGEPYGGGLNKHKRKYDKNKPFSAIVYYKEARKQKEIKVFEVKRKLDLEGFETGDSMWDKDPEKLVVDRLIKDIDAANDRRYGW